MRAVAEPPATRVRLAYHPALAGPPPAAQVRLACRNNGNADNLFMAFDVACGAAGTKTLQAWGQGKGTGDALGAWTYVGPAC